MAARVPYEVVYRSDVCDAGECDCKGTLLGRYETRALADSIVALVNACITEGAVEVVVNDAATPGN
jgi:hypothetical protein